MGGGRAQAWEGERRKGLPFAERGVLWRAASTSWGATQLPPATVPPPTTTASSHQATKRGNASLNGIEAASQPKCPLLSVQAVVKPHLGWTAWALVHDCCIIWSETACLPSPGTPRFLTQRPASKPSSLVWVHWRPPLPSSLDVALEVLPTCPSPWAGPPHQHLLPCPTKSQDQGEPGKDVSPPRQTQAQTTKDAPSAVKTLTPHKREWTDLLNSNWGEEQLDGWTMGPAPGPCAQEGPCQRGRRGKGLQLPTRGVPSATPLERLLETSHQESKPRAKVTQTGLHTGSRELGSRRSGGRLSRLP